MPFIPTQTPPNGFFTVEGIYAHRYDISVISTFNTLSSIAGAAGLPDPFNNRSNIPPGQTMSYAQLQDYRRQIELFQTVYACNEYQSTIQTVANPAKPFRFVTYKQFNDYRQGLGIISKVYNVVEGLSLTDIFIFKFPPFGQFPNPP